MTTAGKSIKQFGRFVIYPLILRESSIALRKRQEGLQKNKTDGKTRRKILRIIF